MVRALPRLSWLRGRQLGGRQTVTYIQTLTDFQQIPTPHPLTAV
jgi:hypothetical protein